MTTTDLEALLLVQERDLAIDRLRHRRATLPEGPALTAHLAEQAELEEMVTDLGTQRDEVLARERKLDDEVQALAAHARQVDATLYSGTVTSPRELQALQADLDQLRRHRNSVEDRELECMEQREAIEGELEKRETALAAVRAGVESLRTSIAGTEAEIDAELAVEIEARGGLATNMAAELVADYEQRRRRNRGAGAARLVGDTCQGCRLSIPATEVDRIRRGETRPVAYCDNCGAILVPA